MKIRRNKGFTLAELLIVVAIIAVLVAISIPIFNSQLEKARQAVDLSNMRSAKSAAISEWLTSGATEEKEYKYDASIGNVVESGTPKGYGKSSKNVTDFSTVMEGASGVPNDGIAHYISIRVTAEGECFLRWGGNDLTTPAGRRKEDIDNMHAIAKALTEAMDQGNLYQAKNYVQVAVFKDGTMAYYQDGRGNSEADIKTIKDALQAAGLNTDNTPLHSTDAKWKNGYVIHFEKNGHVNYKAISESENQDKEIKWNWWNKANLSDDDLVD